METKKPVHKMRRRNVEVAVWENASENGSFYRVSLSRIYQTADGKRTSSASFGAKELGDVALLAIDAQRWMREAEDRREDDGSEAPPVEDAE